ncbi:unnamed protein product [Lymnaea stagnalis]|uniref:Cadherin domain-containing protein n=1 Tax=Lymnaea stagnalis TaxID=6523 RepID=A0AAV2I452_LYMST
MEFIFQRMAAHSRCCCLLVLLTLLYRGGSAAPYVNITNLPFTCSIPENTPIGSLIFNTTYYNSVNGTTVVFNINITDPELVPDDGNQDRRFSVDSANGQVYVGDFLNYEKVKTYSLQIKVVNVNNLVVDYKTLTVSVTDVNDNAPECRPYNVLGELKESDAAGTNFTSLACTDVDTGNGGKVEYLVIEGDTGVIAVNSTTGVATIKRTIDYDTEKRDTYQVIVKVRDLGTPSLSVNATVLLSVKDVDDLLPQFSPSTVTGSVYENATVGSTVLTLQATDGDAPDTFNSLVVYQSEGCSPDVFMVDRFTGALIVKTDLDYETNPVIRCHVTAYSSDKKTAKNTASVVITVGDVNDRIPIFDQEIYKATITENSPKGTPVVLVNATDPDAGTDGQVLYSLQAEGNSSGIFTIDASTGNITVLGTVDYETATSHLLTVYAEDQGKDIKNKNSVFVQVTIRPVNEFNPQFNVTEYTYSVAEDSVPGTSVFTAYAFDQDVGLDGALRFNITTIDSPVPFLVDSAGVVRVRLTLDYEKDKTYSFNVFAIDNSTTAERSNKSKFTINIVDVNDAPVICDQVSTQVVKYPFTIGAAITTINCKDNDLATTGTLNYGLSGGNDNGIFQVKNGTGALSLLAISTSNQYNLQVSVYDKDTTTVSFAVLAETELKFTSASTILGVVENTSGFLLTTVAACCAFPKVTYSVKTGNEDNKVTLYSTSGLMWLMVGYDREETPKHEYIILAVSDSGQTATQTLTINVEDVNDNAPVFDSNLYVYKIDESLAVPETIATLTATDKDAGLNATLTYSLNDTTTFQINGDGTLILKASLDYETKNVYTVVLTATDGGNPPLTGTTLVIVNVQNKDESSPVLVKPPSPYSATLSEDSALGATVFIVQATDADAGTTFRYSITTGNINDDFRIDPSSGNITVGKFLDRERTDTYPLTVTAVNQNNASVSGTLTITISDINDNNPEFSQNVYVFYVENNVASGTSVGTVAVTDRDAGDNASVTLTLTSQSPSDAFTLSGSTLSTTVVMAYPSVRYYRMVVVATDKGSPPRSTSCVVVVNVSPSFPKFNTTTDTISIPENQSIGFQIYDLNATALGVQELGVMKYAIQSGVGSQDFLVRQTTGQIIIKNSLNYETQNSYILVISAYNPDSSQDSFTLNINVLNINEFAPIFLAQNLSAEQETFKFLVSETAPSRTVVGAVSARDEDAGEFGNVTHTLIGGQPVFQIDSKTGVITLNAALDYLVKSYYSFVVNAKDGGSPPKSANASVVIELIDENNHSPVFQSVSNTSVLDSAPIGSEVFRFRATDLDTGLAGNLSYSISVTDKFTVNSTTGILTTTSLLDAAVVPQYTLTVTASDKGSPVLTAVQSFTINVVPTNPNNNDPIFSDPNPVTVTVARTAPAGTPVVTTSATDADKGISGQLVYKITFGNSDGYFVMDRATGTISTATGILRAANSYTLGVMVTDQGTPSRQNTTSVTIQVAPGLTIEPIRTDYNFTIAENKSPGFEVGRIAVDPVRTTTGYSIKTGNWNSAFDISRDGATGEGVLVVKGALDYEMVSLYSLEIVVTTDILDFVKLVKVQLTDVNDNPPVFSPASLALSIPENLPTGHTVTTISYTDADVTPAFRVNLLELKTPGDVYFEIDQSGHLKTKTSLDYESGPPTITFDVVAKDLTDSSLSSTITITVTVIDVLEEEDRTTSSITNSALMSFEVPYQATSGHLIYTLTPGDFGIIESATANVEFVAFKSTLPFSIATYTGELTVSGSLNNKSKYFLWALCRSTDGGTTTSKVSLLRIDTFDLTTQVVVIEFAEAYSDMKAKISAFRTRTQLFFTQTQRVGFSNLLDTSSGSRRKLLATTSAAYTYVVSDTSADAMANVNQDKSFMTDKEILGILQQSADGTPVTGLSDPAILEVSAVEPYQETQSSSADEFLSSPGGIVMFCLLGLLLLVALILLIVFLCHRKNKNVDKWEEKKGKDSKDVRGEKVTPFFKVSQRSASIDTTRQHHDPSLGHPPKTLINTPNSYGSNDKLRDEHAAEKSHSNKSVEHAEPVPILHVEPTKDTEVKSKEETTRIFTTRGDTNNNVSLIKYGRKSTKLPTTASAIPGKDAKKNTAVRKTSEVKGPTDKKGQNTWTNSVPSPPDAPSSLNKEKPASGDSKSVSDEPTSASGSHKNEASESAGSHTASSTSQGASADPVNDNGLEIVGEKVFTNQGTAADTT